MYKIIIRTLFYHWLLLCVGISVGFILNAEWVGYKSVIVTKSINNIFFPIKVTDDIKELIKNIGKEKIRILAGNPKNFVIIADFLYDNEIYWAEYEYTDAKGGRRKTVAKTRVYWKPWEYYYHMDQPIHGGIE